MSARHKGSNACRPTIKFKDMQDRRALRSGEQIQQDNADIRKSMAQRIVCELDALLNDHKELLKLFKSNMPKLQSDNHTIVINPHRTSAREHIHRFNAPVVHDLVLIMVVDRTATRQIVIRRRNNNLHFIADTHRLYGALQYPLIFWKGQDGYCINIKQRDPVTEGRGHFPSRGSVGLRDALKRQRVQAKYIIIKNVDVASATQVKLEFIDNEFPIKRAPKFRT
ncbi:hypothetical protein EVAR_14007_1 [Eumeta japonica]|uniref:Uncharacterized protein n=1 Tax=Eumeta variegata TaxID=151549 RepID=A0A4C1XDI4_EUMVA|nr:hypothetical protein EVAR_14007_1 [Eumeta japonica]